jgi:hypothetical protein
VPVAEGRVWASARAALAEAEETALAGALPGLEATGGVGAVDWLSTVARDGTVECDSDAPLVVADDASVALAAAVAAASAVAVASALACDAPVAWPRSCEDTAMPLAGPFASELGARAALRADVTAA